jgi:hypothetical protein
MLRAIAAELLETLPQQPSPWDLVDALVPAWADMAVVCVPREGVLRVAAFAHIDPIKNPQLWAFQELYKPTIVDPISVVARVFRTRHPELVLPIDAAALERHVADPGLRSIVGALGPRTTLVAPILPELAAPPLGVIVTAMSSSGRNVDENDLETLATFARLVSRRIQL